MITLQQISHCNDRSQNNKCIGIQIKSLTRSLFVCTDPVSVFPHARTTRTDHRRPTLGL